MGEVGDGFNVAKKMRDGGNFEMAEYSPQQSIIIIYFKLHSAWDLGCDCHCVSKMFYITFINL